MCQDEFNKTHILLTFASDVSNSLTPSPPFVSQCQNFPYPVSPLCQPMTAFSKPPPLFGCWHNLWTAPNLICNCLNLILKFVLLDITLIITQYCILWDGKNILGKLPDHLCLQITTFNFEECRTLTQICQILFINTFSRKKSFMSACLYTPNWPNLKKKNFFQWKRQLWQQKKTQFLSFPEVVWCKKLLVRHLEVACN